MKTIELEVRFIEAGASARLARMLSQRFAMLHEQLERQQKLIEALIRRKDAEAIVAEPDCEGAIQRNG